MAYTLIDSLEFQSTAGTTNDVTSGEIDFSGVDTIFVCVTHLGTVTNGSEAYVTDSSSNTYTQAVSKEDTFSGGQIEIWVAYSATVTSTMTFRLQNQGSGTAYFSGVVMGFSGGLGSLPTDQTNSAAGVGVTSLQAGSITPSEDNELVIAALSGDIDTGNIDESYVHEGSIDGVASESLSMEAAYKIQTTATATNPTWSFPSQNPAAVIASFKAASTAGLGRIIPGAPA